ncbi:dentin sialophosphoprotein [Eucalyptus grandis]|uniref:dentin sialophosphoprotein n=1 Tax=Eucalyptus grandis TaxID=71139 RepID=UPI00192EA573|nr:dentin sialophosphoprotein [Eucalyptus grandis]
MIIRLAPDLVEEIRRAEAQGGNARIKFDANPKNPLGNVIDVGGKEFRFTWSREFGDLCDIYEERQSGEDGNGQLVESGSAWRKLNVQRVLDESTKNHVKMRYEEAERKLNARKAIILEPGNPSMKSQIKQLAAVEVNPRRMPFMQKKELPFKKQKVGPSSVPVGGPPKSAFKSTPSMPSKTAAKGRSSSSPLPSPPDQSGASTPPSGAASNSKKNVGLGDTVDAELMKRDSIDTCERNPSKVARAVEERPARSSNFGDRSMDLQSMLISLLKKNPKGMSLKALEKAVGDTIPNSGKKIDAIMKKIATFQAPGRYLLKPGVDVDSFKGPSPGNGSSPEDNYNQRSAAEEDLDQTSVPGPTLIENAQQGQVLERSNSAVEDGLIDSETVDIEQNSPDIFGDQKNSDHSEGRAGSSSDSGSDSDSESGSSDSRSGSGSPSGSRSRSRSPVGSGSGSSSDSESDASSNSKEGSDEDVDIMTSDDDKEPKHNFQVLEPVLSSLPHEDRAVQDEFGDKQEEHNSNVLYRQKDLPNDGQDIETDVNEELMGDVNRISPNQEELLEKQSIIGSLFDERREIFEDSFRREQSDSSDRIAHRSRRGYDLQHSDVKRDRVKRSKVQRLAQPSSPGGNFPQHMSPPILSPGRPTDDPFKSPVPIDGTDRDVIANPGFQKAPSQTFPGKSTLHSQQTGRRSSDQGVRGLTQNTPRRPNKRSESLDHDQRFSDKSSTVQEGLTSQKDKSGKDAYSEGFTPEKVSKGMKDGLSGGKHSLSAGSLHSETIGKPKDIEQSLNLHTGSLPKDYARSFSDRSSPANVRGAMLQRELSDLELGELREPVPEEAPVKKQFERKGSFKQPETKSTNSDSWKTDLGRGKPPGMPSADSGKLSPSNSSVRMTKSSEGFSRKRSRDDELATSIPQGSQSQLQQSSRIDHAEIAGPLIKTLDVSKSRKNEMGESQGTASEEFGKSQKVASANGSRQPHKKRGQVSHLSRETKIQASSTAGSMMNGQKDVISAPNGGQKRRESSSDESSCSYSKYEKDEPELKGQIKDYAQYKEYVQEFRDKYDSYCSLNKLLENYRNEFQKMEKDLEFARGKDMERYNNILAQLKESYRRCGERHKRLKKIFIVLHEELKHLKEMIKDFASAYSKE